jgi:hypothetical protein
VARSGWVWTVCWVVAASAGFILVGAEAARYPLSAPLIVLGVLAPAFLLGLLGARYLLCFWSLMYVPIVLIAASVGDEPLVVIALPFAVAGAAAMIAIGVTIGRVVNLSSFEVWALATGIAVLAFAPAAVAYVQRHRTVRVHRSHPLLIDEREGTVSGVGLGDRVSEIVSAFGPAPVTDSNSGYGPLESDDNADGLSTRELAHERDLRYRRLYFAADTRVRYLAVTDRHARLSKGVGPGDSMSLIRRAYPGLYCREETTGADGDIFYPVCDGQIAPSVWAYVAGDYTQPGVPVSQIWLADADFVP